MPLHGHTPGHGGVALRLEMGWHFRVGDAGPIGLQDNPPERLVRTFLGQLTPRSQGFAACYPDLTLTTGHMGVGHLAQVAL